MEPSPTNLRKTVTLNKHIITQSFKRERVRLLTEITCYCKTSDDSKQSSGVKKPCYLPPIVITTSYRKCLTLNLQIMTRQNILNKIIEDVTQAH